MSYVESFRSLETYKLARVLAREIFETSKRFPKEEMYALTNQGRRSSRSVGAQIAEAWGKRRYEKHFMSKLTDADGEQLETPHWVEIALDCNYVSKDKGAHLLLEYEKIGKMLNSMMPKSASFCKKD